MTSQSETGPPGPTRVFLVDDHNIVRSGLRMLIEIEEGFVVVGEAGSGKQAISQLTDLVEGDADMQPHVVLMDLMMEGMNGIEATKEIKERWPEFEVLVLTMANDPAYLREAFRAGAAGYVLKDAVNDELIDAIKTVAEGGRYLHMSLAAKLAQAEAKARDQNATLKGLPLSKREVEVVRLVSLGHSNREVAEQLFISVRTVESHRMNIKQKTGLKSRADLVRFAMDAGLVDREL